MWAERNINAWLAGFFVLLVLGMVYHQDPAFAGSAFGHSLGIAGTVLIFMALIYPFRKRVLKKKGRQNPLNSHVTYGLIGPSLVVIHSAHKFTSRIGTLIFLALLLVVISGIIGRFLYRKVNRSLREQKRALKTLINRFGQRRQEMGAACATTDESLEEDHSEYIETECSRWAEEAAAIADREYTVTFFDRLKQLFSKWIRVHYWLTAFLFALIAVHVVSTIYYGLRWLP